MFRGNPLGDWPVEQVFGVGLSVQNTHKRVGQPPVHFGTDASPIALAKSLCSQTGPVLHLLDIPACSKSRSRFWQIQQQVA